MGDKLPWLRYGFPEYRHFDGKRYRHDRCVSRKREAEARAKEMRMLGFSARIVYEKGNGYAIYIRGV
jgi:hypothetical protein